MKEEELKERLRSLENAVIYLAECIQNGSIEDVRQNTIHLIAEYSAKSY